jgi:hypothetical protein
MNYTNCYNLFTADQKARVLASAASVYRISLNNSLGATATNMGTPCMPKVNFEFTEAGMTEASAGTVDCRKYTDYTYNLVIGSNPSASATATLSVTSGTATEGVDFDITTNGNFITSSKTVSFPAGTNAAKAFTIRIYNDAGVEGAETFTLAYTVNNGGGNAAAGNGRPDLTITIGDNDVAPNAGLVTTATIGSSAGSLQSPFTGAKPKQKSELLYTAAELTAAGITAGNINALALNIVKSSGAAFQYLGLTIKMGQTSQSTLYTASVDFPVNDAGFTTVYNGNYSTVDGWNNFPFSTPFVWDGTSNIVVVICYDNSAATLSTNDACLAYADGNAASRYVFSLVNCSGTFSSFSRYNQYKPIIRFTYTTPGTSVQSVINSSKQEYLGPNGDVYFYDQADNKLLARVRNLTAHNYGCTQLTIDRAGSSAAAFWNNNAGNYLLSKTYRIQPTTNNSSGQYEVTFYFTEAEKVGWEAATGQSWNNILLIKVPGQINNYSPSTPAPDGANAVQTGIPVRGMIGTFYTLTYTFTTGFSGFGVGIPGTGVLPVTLLNFRGRQNGDAAILDWSTSTEQALKNFDIEKSTDGINYHTTGTVTAVGNSTSSRNYTYRDNNLTGSNYYRLRMNDMNGFSRVSGVVVIKYEAIMQRMWIVNNPFDKYIDVRFAKNPKEKVVIELTDASGKLIIRKTVGKEATIRVDLSNVTLSPGSYIFKAIIDGKVYTAKLIK